MLTWPQSDPMSQMKSEIAGLAFSDPKKFHAIPTHCSTVRESHKTKTHPHERLRGKLRLSARLHRQVQQQRDRRTAQLDLILYCTLHINYFGHFTMARYHPYRIFSST